MIEPNDSLGSLGGVHQAAGSAHCVPFRVARLGGGVTRCRPGPRAPGRCHGMCALRRAAFPSVIFVTCCRDLRPPRPGLKPGSGSQSCSWLSPAAGAFGPPASVGRGGCHCIQSHGFRV